MAGEWRERPLGELTENFDGVRVPVKESDRKSGPYPYYGASGIVDHVDGFLFDGEYLLIAEDGENLRTRTTPVAFMARGKFWVNNHAHIVRGNNEADTRFLMYSLAATDISGYLTGSTMPKLTQGNMNRISLLTPPLPEQRAIARILGALDDKIERNRRMSETLEGMARALFKSWFVNFDHASAMKDGWGLEEIGRHVEPCRGFSYDGASLSRGGVPFHNLNSIFEGGGYKHEGIKSLSGDFDDRCAVEPGDVIVANTEQGHDRLLLGSAALIPRRYGPRTPFSHHLYRVRVRPESPLRPVFVLHLLNDPYMHDLISRYGNGTTVNMLPMDALELPQIVVPPADLVAKFEEVVLPLHDRVEAAVVESETLSALRDALLPKLVSGEMRVTEPGHLVGRAA